MGAKPSPTRTGGPTVMGTVSAVPVAPGDELPERVREALGELAGAAKEGLLALSVGVGLGVLHELMEAEVDEVVGPKRRHARTGEPVGAEVDALARSQSKSAVSREFVSRTREHLIELMSRPLADLRLAVLMLDAIELKGRCCVVALGIDSDGVKHPLGLWDGSTENATVATTLVSNLVERGLDVEQGVLVVIDGAKALRKAVRDVLGVHTPVQRCVRHKERNVLGHLPERDRPLVRRRLRQAWALDVHDRALDQLRSLADELAHTHPGAAASLREGIEETLTVTRLGVRGRLKRTLASHEPVRVDDRDRPPHLAQRQALAERRHVSALDRCRDARSRAPVPQDHRPHRPR